MKKKPLVSILITNYNKKKYLKDVYLLVKTKLIKIKKYCYMMTGLMMVPLNNKKI